MNSLSLGAIAFLIIVYLSAEGADPKNYLNMHSFVIVILGTIAIFVTSNTKPIMWAVYHAAALMFKKRPDLSSVKDELMQLSQDRTRAIKTTDPLIQYAISLWEKGLDANTFQALISQYRDKLEHNDVEAITALQNLAKYPPALGMLGTVMGMINLFASLSSSDKSGLGPALAVAMTATFYGLLLSNGILMPLADRIFVEATHRKKYYGLVYEMITMINRREPTSMVEEEFKLREAA